MIRLFFGSIEERKKEIRISYARIGTEELERENSNQLQHAPPLSLAGFFFVGSLFGFLPTRIVSSGLENFNRSNGSEEFFII